MAKSKSTATSQDTAAPPTDDDKIRAANRLTDLEFASYQRTIEPPNTERELPFGLKALPIAINSHVQQPNRLYIEVSQYVREQLEAAATKITDQQAEVERLKEEHDWIRTKLGLPLDTPFISGKGDTLAGRMHVVCSNADGYVRYIAAYRCNDKQGEIARQSVELASLRLQLSQAERQRDDLSFLIRDTVANCLTDPGDALSKEIMAGTPDAACDKLTVECDAMEQQLAEARRAIKELRGQLCDCGHVEGVCEWCQENPELAALATQEPTSDQA